jgi:hypothetical protein
LIIAQKTKKMTEKAVPDTSVPEKENFTPKNVTDNAVPDEIIEPTKIIEPTEIIEPTKIIEPNNIFETAKRSLKIEVQNKL